MTTKETLWEKFKTIILFIAIILLLLIGWTIGKDWLKPNLVKLLGGYTESEVKYTRDTTSIKYNDIYVKYKKLQTSVSEISEPEYITEYKYIKIPSSNEPPTTGETSSDIFQISSVKRYNTVINDTILSGNIETVLSLDSCKIVSQTLKYEPKIPYIREKVVTITETKETILKDKPKAYIGIGLDVNTLNQATPSLMYLSKKKWMYKGGYTKTLDNQYPDAVTIGISKFF